MARNQSSFKRKEKPAPPVPKTKVKQVKTEKIKERFVSFLPILTGVLFAITAYVALSLNQTEFLYRSQELSLFLPTRIFFQEQMVVPGGFIVWLGAFFTQFFYYPWLGIGILVGFWVLIYALSLAVFKVPRQWALLGLIAPVALLATVTALGYWLFHLKTVGYLYSNTLGFLFLLLTLWVYQVLSSRLKVYWIFFSLALGYPLWGAYALLAGLYMLILSVKTEEKRFQRILQPSVALVMVLLVPVIWYYIYNQLNFRYIYVAVLPVFLDPDLDFSQWIPFLILFLSLLPLVFLGRTGPRRSTPKAPFYRRYTFLYLVLQCLFLACFVGIGKSFMYKDANFQAELFMDQAAKNQDWEAIIQRAYQEQGEPTRMMVMLKNLALLRQGKGGDQMFRFPDGGARPNARFEQRMTQAGGKIIYLNYAKLNFCYRWCLEDAVEYGMKVEYLKYMAQCAIYSGDHQVARKYLRTLKQTLFHADWAREQEKLLDDPALLNEDPTYQHIMALYDYPNRLDGDQNLMEIYLLNYFSNTWNSSPLYQEVSMMCTLIMKDIPLFWPRFFSYIQTHQRVPVHYQEAAVLYCYLEKEFDAETLPVDEHIKSRFQAFQDLIARNPGRSEESLRPLFKSQFGDTFWYFYFFIRNVKSN